MNSSIRPASLTPSISTPLLTSTPSGRTCSNRGTDVLWIETAREEDREGGADLGREPPIGTHSGPAGDSSAVAIDQDSQRRLGARSVAVDLGHDVRRVRSGPRSQGLQRRHRQVPQRLGRLGAMELEGIEARLSGDLAPSPTVRHRRTRRPRARFARARPRERPRCRSAPPPR